MTFAQILVLLEAAAQPLAAALEPQAIAELNTLVAGVQNPVLKSILQKLVVVVDQEAQELIPKI